MPTKKSAAQLDREIAEALARPVSQGTAIAYEEAKAARDVLATEVAAATAVLKTFPGGPMGLTPDSVRLTPEYRTANARFQRAFAALRAFNAGFTKTFAKELRAERAEQYASRTSRHHSTRIVPVEVGQFVAWESPNTGAAVKGRVQERQEIDGKMLLRIKIAGSPGDAIMPESAVRVLAKKH